MHSDWPTKNVNKFADSSKTNIPLLMLFYNFIPTFVPAVSYSFYDRAVSQSEAQTRCQAALCGANLAL